MLQSQQIPPRNHNIQLEIRSRKQQISDDVYSSSQPFRSYRKVQPQHTSTIVADTANSHSTEEVKLLRQYSAYSVTLEPRQNRPSGLKFRYDLKESDSPNMKEIQHSKHDEVRQSNQQHKSVKMNLNDKTLTNKFLNTPGRRFQLANKSNCKSEVKSIFFDSKVSNFESYDSKVIKVSQNSRLINDKDLQLFKLKVNRVNQQIEEGIAHLEKMIEEARKKKIYKSIMMNKENTAQKDREYYAAYVEKRSQNKHSISQIVSKLEEIKKDQNVKIQEKLSAKKQQKNEKIMQDRKQQSSSVKLAQNQVQNEIQLKKETLQNQMQGKNSQQTQEQQEIENQNELLGDILQKQQNLQNVIKKIKNTKSQDVQQTHIIKRTIELNGQNNKKTMLPQEYTSFINRLVSQIHLDIQFTNMISQLSKNNQLSQIKALIFSELQKYQNGIEVIQDFFLIQSSEIDPLQPKKPFFTMRYKEQEGRQQALRVYKKYKQMQTYFNTKLKKIYDVSVINTLLDELSQFNFTKNDLQDKRNVTIGHLLSYLNMKTNKSLRNRYFVKMMKRLNLRGNQSLTFECLRIFIAQ